MTLITVVIPSAGRRPELLERAIKSAIIDDLDIQTEIVVILNGEDGVKFDMNSAFGHPLVKYYKLEEGNVSKARNYGLSIAKGKFIRFLDDDDYLSIDIHQLQISRMVKNNYDISTCDIDILDETGKWHGRSYADKISKNGLVSLLSVNCVVLPLAHLYKASFIKDCKWNEAICNAEDLEWLHTVARKRPRWIIYDECVGYWYQHNDNNRLSYATVNQEATKVCAEQLMCTYKVHKNNEALSNLESIVAYGLWKVIHKAFYLDPFYWTKIALFARKLDPKAVPEGRIFVYFPFPLFIEWLMIPKRLSNFLWRILKAKVNRSYYIRKF
ncbi:glycosyltransferase family 2 protein [Acinetobacter portensis]|uniref:glycosyltransferase family 2 protein n=1 Tax=Acinetobacter portensis TaxID=1839785 RepID=UPI0013D1A6F8|nr:glycosyltransferase family 2 protein [Acinetobacter portensis]